MQTFDLIDYVVPRGGIYNVIGMKDGKLIPKFTNSLETAYEIAEEFSEQNTDVYFALGKLKEKGNRKVDNVESLGAIWLDIDCGAGKAEEIEPSTGLPKGYASQAEGAKALKVFCGVVDLPEPTIVNSGYGLHVYWAFTEEVPTEKWIPIAQRLKEICVTQKFYADPNVFDPARILRVPGTYNQKKATPRLVKVINVAPERHAPDTIRELLNVNSDAVVKKPSVQTVLDPLQKLLAQNQDYKFSKIISRQDPCLQLKDSLMNRATLSEPRWFNALSVAKFCQDGSKAIHTISQGHPDYNFHAVERKIIGIKGAHSCEEFERNNPKGCDGCVHKKSKEIKGPYNLGQVVKKDRTSPINKFEPYFRGEKGGVYKMQGEDPKLVYEHDLYIKKQMWDSEEGFVSVFRFHSPHDGVIEFTVPNESLEKRLLLRTLAHYGVVTGSANANLLAEYVTRTIQILQTKRKADIMRTQFGWADNHSKFIVGEREITVDGVYHTPASKITRTYTPYFEPRGTLDKWKEVFNLYNAKGLEIQAFAALSGFGSPLLELTGQKGAIINLVHKNAGTGKTTVLRMANSIYGEPEALLGNPKDTAVARVNKLGILNNVINTVDELSNMDSKQVSDFAYEVSQGKGKDKGTNTANANRKNDTTWRNITLSTSNSSFYQKLYVGKSLPDGEIMRIIEFHVDYVDPNIISTTKGKQMFDHQLNANYGHAIVPFIQYVIANLDKVKRDVRKIQKKIDKELRLTSRERNWSAIVAANIAAGIIASDILGIIDFDMHRIYIAATKIIKKLRKNTIAPVDSYVSVLGGFISANLRNLLVVNGKLDKRSQKEFTPEHSPTYGNLVMRLEPDTQLLFIPVKLLRAELSKDETDYESFKEDLKTKGIYIKTDNKRMSKGMAITTPAQRCLIFNAAHPEFIDMSNIVEQIKENADRESELPDQLEEV